MIRLDAKKSSLLLATIMLAKLASAQGLPWFDDPPAQTAVVQNESPGQTPASSNYGAAGCNHNRSFHGDHTRRDPGAHGPEEPAAYHVGNSGLWSLP